MGRRTLVLAALPHHHMKTITTSLFLLGLATGFACTSDVRAFCERLDECGESLVRSNQIDDCEAKFEQIRPSSSLPGFDPEICEAELGRAAEADSCEAFSDQDLCSLCTPVFMGFILGPRWNGCAP